MAALGDLSAGRIPGAPLVGWPTAIVLYVALPGLTAGVGLIGHVTAAAGLAPYGDRLLGEAGVPEADDPWSAEG